MAKRVKLTLPQARIELGTYGRTGRVYVRVDDDHNVFIGNAAGGIWLTIEQWQALVSAVEVIDVPTPGERWCRCPCRAS